MLILCRIALVAAILASQAALAGGPDGSPPLEALPTVT